eukprot:8358696-Karenia_brevis.AAC.1
MTAHIAPMSCRVWREFPTHNASDDHFPLRASVAFESGWRAPVVRRRVAMYDRQAVSAARSATEGPLYDAKINLERYLLDFPPVDVCIDPTSHMQLIADYVSHGLTEHFPRQKCRRKQIYLSQPTFDLVQRKGRIASALTAVGRKLKTAIYWFALQWWYT